ncbi:SusC/RagA family TonB-linked outer membrane protein [Sphingobacterium tabacisoli]|uniref:SusC/RagA family TonB-linked outer membrane protein n=1 Tax=Sphingobacterium tabacisoli TaxID=2044855 RepID=A0ABW5L021_9SPHI|nr:SusC/RagA family TonB-linked outer membrane protein [Sphingobacterium tabacisoli]
MKLIVLFLTISLCNVQAEGFAQKINLNERNVSLETIIRKIRVQSGYDFIGDAKFIKSIPAISVNVKDASINQALDAVFATIPIEYSIDRNIIALKKKSSPMLIPLIQQVRFIGRIVNEKGEGLAGASVRIADTQTSTSTNSLGEFTLVSPSRSATLVISYLGYQPLELKAKENMGIIKLSPIVSDLEDVVVTVNTGYQTMSKERATGSFSQVGQEVLSKRPTSNLSSALQGAVAGMQAKENADGSVDFLIRGNSTLHADSKPLVVIDGFPVASSNFSDINPNDVESVTVLKDAAAASIWGARAANGVIVIMTKKGKLGSRLKVQGSAFSRISNMLDLNQVMTQANSADHIAYERKAFENNWVLSPYAGSFGDVSKSLTLAQELLYANQNGQITTEVMNAELDRLSKVDNRGQIKEHLLQRGLLNQFNANVQSGSDRSRTYASVLYENNKGSFKNNSYDRFNLNFNNDFKIASFLTFNLGANLQYKKQEYGGTNIKEIQELSPYELLLNPDGTYGTNLKVYNREQLGLIPSEKFPYADWSYNLLQEVRGRSFTEQGLNARIQTGLNARIIEGLTFDTKFQYERIKTDRERIYDESTFYVRGLVNRMTEYNDATKTVGKSYIPKGGILKKGLSSVEDGLEENGAEDIENYVFRNQLNFDRVIGADHHITAIAGMEISQYTTLGKVYPTVYGYYGDKLQATTPPYGYGSSVDQFKNFENNTATVPGANTVFKWRRNKFASFYGNAAYTYKGRYTLSGSIRSDGSNFITDDPKLRWSPLWSVGGKWNLMKEDFLTGKSNIDRLEARLTYGKNGNMENSTSTATLLNVGGSLNPSTGTITATIRDNGNPSLRWEETTTTNFGVDFSFFKSRLFGSVDFYRKKGTGIIGKIALPTATGTSSQKFNNAEISNKGIEVVLGTDLQVSRLVRYNTSFNYAYNKNNVDKLYNPSLYVYQMIEENPTDPSFVENVPVGSVYAFEYLGMKNGVPRVAGPNGSEQSFNDVSLYNRGLGMPFLSYMGTSVAPHTLGWINNVSIGDFNVMLVLVGKFGGVYRNPVFNYASTVGGNQKTFVNQYVSEVLAGDPDVPGFAAPNETKLYLWDRYANALSSRVESSSYLEAKELTVEYTLANKWTENIKMDQVKVFLQTRDLGLIWQANSRGYNPDWLPGSYRPVQTYTVGVNFQF